MKISDKKKEKICEQILFYMFSQFPKPTFTSYIAKEIARDEEYTKKLLLELKQRKLILEINKNSEGIRYMRWSRWVLSKEAQEIYKKNQTSN